jgi:hypothetical protein
MDEVESRSLKQFGTGGKVLVMVKISVKNP